jgi:hypothetical protein
MKATQWKARKMKNNILVAKVTPSNVVSEKAVM